MTVRSEDRVRSRMMGKEEEERERKGNEDEGSKRMDNCPLKLMEEQGLQPRCL